MYRTNDNMIDPPVITFTESIDARTHQHIAPKKYITEQRKETALYNIVDFMADRQELVGIALMVFCCIAAYLMVKLS
jgi:hypothetical protein